MRVLAVRAVLAAALLLPAGAGAQSLSLTEAQAIARLSDESPRVQAARASVDVARADALTAARLPNPRVTFNREAVSGVAENYFMVSQTLPVTGRRRLEMSAASSRVEAASSRVDGEVRRLRAELRLAFTDLWAAQQRERELVRNRERLRELADVLAKREAGGESAGFDRLRAEREVLDVESDRAGAASDRARAQGVLTSFFPAALPAADGVEAVGTAPNAATLPSVEELVARAEMARGDLLSLTHERDVASLMTQVADRRRLPEPEVVAGTKSSNAGTGDMGSIVSVHVNVPLFDRGRAERAAAQARAGQVDAQIAALRLTMQTEISAWRAAVIERRAIAARYRTAVGGGTDDIERIAQISYDNGEGGILELLDAHRTASSARVRQVMLDAAVREAEIELEFVSGWEIP
ncbi:MAG: TolC family protein [Acidobacteria bacterium]|nr:TolC family protein [Acidobacteriota bacterium]